MKINVIQILICLFCITNSVAQKQQNVLMIVLDDLNDFTGVLKGHPQAHTPNIDRLAKEGVLFTNAHSNVPVCSPSRASFMNGISPVTSKYWGFKNWKQNDLLMACKSIPEYFMANGYHTAKSGKVFHSSKKGAWHDEGVKTDYGPTAFNGLKAAQHPACPEAMFQLGALDATFVSLKDIPKVEANNESPGYDGWYLTKLKKAFKYINDNDRDLMPDETSVEWFKTKIQKLETSLQDVPFFISLGFHRPHTPLVVPQKYFDLFPIETVEIPNINFSDIDDTKLGENSINESRGRKAYRWLTESYSSVELALKKYTQAYLASVAFADDMVGKTLDALEKSSFKENTTIILFSDHGYNIGEKEYLFKYCLWEESTRVPLIIKSPYYEKSMGKQVDHPVSLIDIYPTLKDLCKLEGSTIINSSGAPLDGYSLKPFLENPKTNQWEGPDTAFTIVSSWKSKLAEKQHVSVRSKQYRYIRYANGSEELYNHKKDDFEWHNLADDRKYLKIKEAHRKQLDLWLKIK